MEPLPCFQIQNQVQDFVADYNCSIVKHFNIKVPDYTNPVIIKAIGISGHKSDGEQHILPVLSNKQLLTESIALSAKGSKTKKLEFRQCFLVRTSGRGDLTIVAERANSRKNRRDDGEV